MTKISKCLKKYYSLSGANKYLIALEFVALLIPAICSIFTPIYTANVISALTVYDFADAVHNLNINFIIIIVSALFYLIYHLISRNVRMCMSRNLHSYVYENVKYNKNIPALNLSILTGIENLINFNRELLYKFCFFIKSLIVLGIIIYYNALIGIILICVSIISFLLLNLTDSKIKKYNRVFAENQSKTLELFNSIKRGSEEEKNFNFEDTLKNKYFKLVDESIKTNNRTTSLFFINNNIISLILKSAVYGLTIYLVTLVKSTTLTLSLFLILTPYLTSSAQNLIEFFEIFASIGETDNILTELDSLKFISTPIASNKKYDFDSFNLTFYLTELKDKKPPTLTNLNLTIKENKSVLFVGGENEETTAIYLLLQRKTKPTSGSIFIADKNIFDITPEIYQKLISFTSKEPNFFNLSIIENLTMVCPSKAKIIETLKLFGLKKEIDGLDEKLNTNINKYKNKKFKYFLGIARAYLTGSKILVISEYPEALSSTERVQLKKILKLISKQRTLLFLSNNSDFSECFDETIYLQKNN